METWRVYLVRNTWNGVPRVDDQDPGCIVTSPGIRPDSLVMLDAYERGIKIWSEIELAWRLNQRQGRVTPKWLCLTGTNGKTTTVGNGRFDS